jgi:DNA-binding NarL/FixJ family response regulator
MIEQIIKVAIIEDQHDIREGLAWIIRSTEGLSCAGTFRSMEEALQKIGFELPDVILTDIGLPGMSGIEGIHLLKERYPKLRLLMLTVYEDDEMIFDALCAGACGYLLKRTSPVRLIESLREVMRGGAPMSPEVASRVIRLFRDLRPPERADYELTPHETRLLELLVEGHNYKTAAEELGVSVITIASNMRNVYGKLQAVARTRA